MAVNLARILVDSAAAQPQQIAIKLDDFELSYALLDEAAMRVAALLRTRGVGPGDRVAVMVPNVPQFAAIYFGVLRAGAIVVPLNVLSVARELQFFLSDSGAKLLFVWEAFLAEAMRAVEPTGCEAIVVDPEQFTQQLFTTPPLADMSEAAPSDTAVILYTSGTTGTPKGAELTHANLMRNCEISRALFELSAGTVVLGALPLFHAFGQTCALNTCIAAAGMLTLIPRFDGAKALEIIARDKVEVFEGVPTMYASMLNAPNREQHDVASLRVCASGGAAMPVQMLRAFEDTFGCKVLEGYGLSETSPVASFNRPERPRKPGSIGQPVDGVEMKVVDDADHEVPVGELGEIVIRGHNVMKGYWGRPEESAAAIRDGWFHTGDIARVDADGYFFIVDRKKDLIIRNGLNVYPREVEEVLYGHPAVREAAVVGLPHDEYGEEIGAVVALKAGQTASPDELRDFVKSQVAAYKYPRRVWIVDDLPKGPTGKILKRAIERPDLS